MKENTRIVLIGIIIFILLNIPMFFLLISFMF